MYDKILVPTDGSSGAIAATTQAVSLARRFGATIHALYALDAPPAPEEFTDEDRQAVTEMLEDRGRGATIEVQNRAEQFDIPVVRTIVVGEPADTIASYADEHDMDLIVMGAHTREPDSRALGSTTQRVLTRASVPVISVTEIVKPEDRIDRVVIPTDGSDVAERSAEHGLQIAERTGADVRVIYVIDSSTYGLGDSPRSIVGLLREGGETAVDAIASEARERNLSTSTAVLRGNPEAEILQYTDGANGDLLVMGTHGEGGASEQLLGSTTARVVRRARVPVLTLN